MRIPLRGLELDLSQRMAAQSWCSRCGRSPAVLFWLLRQTDRYVAMQRLQCQLTRVMPSNLLALGLTAPRGSRGRAPRTAPVPG